MAFDAHFRAVAGQVFNDLGLYQQVSGLYDGQSGAGGDSRPLAVHSPINGAWLADIAGEVDYDRLMERA